MSDYGPIWLQKELPQPIANAWHLAVLGSPVDGLAATTSVEVALRFVTALQLACLLAEGGQAPWMLGRRFTQPTLGSWLKLAKELRQRLRRPLLPELGVWPDRTADARIRALLKTRNAVAHSGQMTPLGRRDADLTLAEQASAVLETLTWLREVELLYALEAEPEGGDRFRGRVQVFRSWDLHPESRRARWEGVVELRHLYLASSASGARRVLDVEPFMRIARLRGAHTESMCLWKGMGERGDVRLSDDLEQVLEWVPVPEAPRLVSFYRLPVRRAPTDATLHEVAVGEPPTVLNRPALDPDAAPAPRAPRSDPRRAARGGRTPRWPLWGALLVMVAGVAVAVTLSAVGGGSCVAPELAGAWRLDTEVRHAKNPAFRGVRGHYTVTFDAPTAACGVPATVRKTGYTQGGREVDNPLVDHVVFEPSADGWSAAAHSHLAGGSQGIDLALRVARRGDVLVGVWRYTNDDWRHKALSGGLFGTRDVRDIRPAEPRCFLACVEGCFDAQDPRDPAADACLRRCAPEIDACGAAR